jgi:hypothetical protein
VSPVLRIIAPSDLCDRCDHPSRRHALPIDGSVCAVRQGTDDKGKPKYCPCDGFFPKP